MVLRRLTSFISLGAIAVFSAINLELMLQQYVYFDRFIDKNTVPNLKDGETFDFIIVGAGSAGSTLASRLSENFRVLLLEAGGHPSPIIAVPLMSQLMNGEAPIDWQYRTVPQKHAAFGLENNVTFWSSGKGLGGSSLVNAALFLRENTQGFNTLAEMLGDPIWKLENLMKYFKSMEDYNGYFKETLHGKGGELGIETAYSTPLVHNLFRAAKEMGYKVRDPNNYGPLVEGFAPMDYYQKFGRRQDAYTSSLLPAMDRKNLVIRKFSFARHLLMNKTRAYGIEYERYENVLRAYATKEVILCAGAIQNPKLLMLAGIGPKDHLEELGIPVRLDLPVGKILEDKYGASVGPFIVDPGKSFKTERDVTLYDFVRWYFYGDGRFATATTEASYQIISNFAKSEGRFEVPDIHAYIVVASPGAVADIAGKAIFNFRQDALDYVNTVRDQDTFFQVVTVSKPFGHGTLRLADKNPHSYPIIDPNYLADKRDVAALVDGLKFAVKLVEETSAFKEINARLVAVPYPGCKQFPFKSDSYFECVARHVTVSAFKYSGTTPIGKDKSDPHAVVDSRFRVLGTEGLRVVGSSMLRVSVVSVNDVTCRVLGILASDLIKMDYLKN